MSKPTYQFAQQLAQGEAFEKQLDAFFREQGFQVSVVSRTMQRQGIDRVFLHRTNGDLFTVEYKADALAGKTGNAFIETVSVDTAHKQGWIHTSQASVLVYLVTDPETIYWLPFGRLRLNLPRWERRYPVRKAQNDGYQTHGLLVPLHELEQLAEVVW